MLSVSSSTDKVFGRPCPSITTREEASATGSISRPTTSDGAIVPEETFEDSMADLPSDGSALEVTATLLHSNLWETFCICGNEMIVTKQGRSVGS